MRYRLLRLVLLMGAAGAGTWANDSLALKGPEKDGTKPALTRIAGEGLMGARAFQYLTELSDDVGARVTGSPQEPEAIGCSVAKMKSRDLENVPAEKWTMLA